ncbi:hypothetical protein [Halalkalicoccus jeotgali]|uniref:Uncharacterized protein n=1 Tax=Halalkalicoccus jeotgali (strain DSM 18796 / CECT 7217 / JCM 14584 / KCTC 4019 / B3) TaxID=795797 RepID=D8J7Y1_HALJB|nr:hypothetical protein [Halalkalicoccus jeotgali]ADJ14094.1 hypothetical protein HacjB3_03515 [Halalkalicoccus jeotgali B3]ELY34476.1 hypothetical protein C497_15787 [Halalkalicoccus jeotgali B3]
MNDPIRTLADVAPHDRVRVTLLNGDRLEGRAQPVEFEPERRVRVELRSGDVDRAIRYDVSSTYRTDEWETPVARRYDVRHEESEWITMGDVSEASITERSSDREDRSDERV